MCWLNNLILLNYQKIDDNNGHQQHEAVEKHIAYWLIMHGLIQKCGDKVRTTNHH
jgi:hypothetical protein